MGSPAFNSRTALPRVGSLRCRRLPHLPINMVRQASTADTGAMGRESGYSP
jgi:hypothetical protein